MKKIIIGLIICSMFIFSTCSVFAENRDYHNICIKSCNELMVSYYNGGEFSYPLMAGYYKYVTSDKSEIEDILNDLSSMKLVPFEGGWGASGGESLNIYVDGEMAISFHLSSKKDYLCRTPDKSYYFTIDECRKLEKTVLKYKTKNDNKVFLDNEEIKFYNSPIIIDDRTLVPAKVICDKLEIKAGWGGDDRIILNKGEKSLVIYNDRVYENKTFIPIDVGCRVIDGLAMIPIRKVAEFFGYGVKWEDNSVYILSL